VSIDSLVIEVGGVGYRVFASTGLIASAVPGARVKVHTFHLVRDDLQALYGFANADELGFFTQLLTVNGVGPKVALAIVGSRPVAELQIAIVQDDQAVLVSVSGVGKRLAARICLELKEKMDAAGLAAGVAAGPAGQGAAREDEVVGALQALGYSLQEARTAARATGGTAAAADSLEERVKAALRSFGRA
jgi:Holliday junction DNA helicase RuvA